MAGRNERYETKDQMEDLGNLSDRLAVDLRRSIQSLALHPVLTPPWCETAETFARIGKVSEMEAKLPKASESSTLWECEEVALRYILEDGKLNLCLRILVQYKEHERDLIKSGKYYELRPDSIEIMDKFEMGAGAVVKNAWQHSEAMQITDLYVLLNHIADVLEFAIDNPRRMKELQDGTTSLTFRQELLVFHYLYSLFKHMDENSEPRIASVVKDRNLFSLMGKMLHLYHDVIRREDLVLASKAMAMLCEAEDFQTYTESYITSEAAAALHDIKEDFLDDLAKDFDVRKAIRPLLDTVRDASSYK